MTEKEILKFKNTRFLFVINSLGDFGGAEKQAIILANYIKANVSKHVSFLAFGEGKTIRKLLDKEQIQYKIFNFNHDASKFKKLLAYYKLVMFIRQLEPDVLLPYVLESNKIIAQIWKFTGAKFAFWNQRDGGRKLFGSKNENKIIRGTSSIISNSFEGSVKLSEIYKIPESRVTIINNGVIINNSIVHKNDYHTQFTIDKKRPLVSMIATISNYKDHITLLNAWHLVIKHFEDLKLFPPFLVLVGRKAETYDNLRLLAFDLNLSNHIGFTDYVSPNNVKDIISQSLFCVFSSNLEGCPNGVLECMEQGKVVIGTNISGVVQALGNKYNSQCLSEPNNAEDLASKIISLYEKPSLLVEIGQYNKQRINTDFSVKKMAEAHLELISQSFNDK